MFNSLLRTGLFGWFRSSKGVVCFGQAHLDTLATFEDDPAEINRVAKPGTILHALGGSAYNIAANLAREDTDRRLDVKLFTVLPKYSPLTHTFFRKMREAGVNVKYVFLLSTLDTRPVTGGGYVALVDHKKHRERHAVVEPALHDADLFELSETKRAASAAVRWSDVVVLTSGLSEATLRSAVSEAKTRPIFVSVGSLYEGKRNWIPTIPSVLPGVTAVAARVEVAIGLLKGRVPDSTLLSLQVLSDTGKPQIINYKEVCNALGTQHLILVDFGKTNDELSGSVIFISTAGAKGTMNFLDASQDVEDRLREGNAAGLTDAALAGFLRAYFILQNPGGARPRRSANSQLLLSFDDEPTCRIVRQRVEHTLKDVAESRGPTPGAMVSLEEEDGKQSKWSMAINSLKIAGDILGLSRLWGVLMNIFWGGFIIFIIYHYYPSLCKGDMGRYLYRVCLFIGPVGS